MGTQNNSPSLFNLKKFLTIILTLFCLLFLLGLAFYIVSYVIGYNISNFLSPYGSVTLLELLFLLIGGATLYYYLSTPKNLISLKVRSLFLSTISLIFLLFITVGAFWYLYWINPSIYLPDTIQCGGALKMSDRVTQICNTTGQDKYTCITPPPVIHIGGIEEVCHLKK